MDDTTGLPPIADLHARAADGVEQAARGGLPVALMVVGLDPEVDEPHAQNRSGAHALLPAAGRTLRRILRATAVVGRLDEHTFAALIPDCGSAQAATQVARRVQIELATLVSLDTASSSGRGVRCSIGICLAPSQARTGDQLLRRAEAALSAARAQGPGRIVNFSLAPSPVEDPRRWLMDDLPAAMRQGQLTLHYQPLFTAAEGRLDGVEALLRWKHPREGLLSADRFVVAAMAGDLADELGRWVMHEACQQARRWQDRGIPIVPMTVNVSAHQVSRPHFLDDVRHALSAAGLPAEALVLDVDAGALLHDPDGTEKQLQACRRAGLRISLDDFGTGHANLATLLRMPVDRIKIDRSFIARVPSCRRSVSMVRALLRMSRELGLDVVAEGVETTAQRDFLRHEDCASLQGHLFAQALDPADYERRPWCRPATAAPDALA